MIFVHGILATPQSTWRSLPKRCLEYADVDIDVLSFAYPSFPWQRSSIESAASRLRELVRSTREAPFIGVTPGNSSRGYSRIIYVAHSNGGLVLKRHMLDALHGPWKDRQELARASDLVNFAVPHSGGTFPLSCLLPAALGCEVFFGLLGVLDWRSNVFNLGSDKIYRQIRWRSSYLCGLEDEFVALQEQYARLCRPFPQSHDFAARDDLAVLQPEKLEGLGADEAGFRRLNRLRRRQLVLRGTHISIKIPLLADDTVVRELAAIVRHRATGTSNASIEELMKKSIDRDEGHSIGELL